MARPIVFLSYFVQVTSAPNFSIEVIIIDVIIVVMIAHVIGGSRSGANKVYLRRFYWASSTNKNRPLFTVWLLWLLTRAFDCFSKAKNQIVRQFANKWSYRITWPVAN